MDSNFSKSLISTHIIQLPVNASNHIRAADFTHHKASVSSSSIK